MKNANAAGASRERQVRALFRDRGYVTFKSSDSSVADVIALRSDLRGSDYLVPTSYPPVRPQPLAEGFLIEVKGNKGGPYMNFRAPDRRALKAVAEQAGLTPLLVHWPPNKPMRELTAEDWPESRVAA